MFSLTLENPEIVRILNALKERIGLFPFEVRADGIQIATMDDGKNMAIWVQFPLEMMKDFEFEGLEGHDFERYMIPSKIFMESISHTSYPLEMGSLMDGSIKVNSANGRQTFKIIPERDDGSETSEYHRNRFNGIVGEEEYVKVRVLKQDLLEAVRTAKVASEQVKIRLEEQSLLLSSIDATVEADGVAPLVEPVVNPNWSHDYNVKLLEFFLGVLGTNREITLYLLSDTDTFLVDIPISEHGFCKMAIAAIPVRPQEGAD